MESSPRSRVLCLIALLVMTKVASARDRDAGDACWECSRSRNQISADCCIKCIRCIPAITFTRFEGAKWCLNKLVSSGCISRNTRGVCKVAAEICAPTSVIPFVDTECAACTAACSFESNAVEKAVAGLCAFAGAIPDA